MTTPFVIRPATVDDAVPAADVLRSAIIDLCYADHQGDPAKIADWTANKTPSGFLTWLRAGDGALLVAEQNGAIVSVGQINAKGRILLNYVSPAARFQGISKAMTQALCDWAKEQGLTEEFLTSTITGRPFYTAMGFKPALHRKEPNEMVLSLV